MSVRKLLVPLCALMALVVTGVAGATGPVVTVDEVTAATVKIGSLECGTTYRINVAKQNEDQTYTEDTSNVVTTSACPPPTITVPTEGATIGGSAVSVHITATLPGTTTGAICYRAGGYNVGTLTTVSGNDVSGTVDVSAAPDGASFLACDVYADGVAHATPQVNVTISNGPTMPPAIAGQGYSLAFGDEFDTLDRTVWDDHIWYDDAPNPAWTNFQYAQDGVLHLVSSADFFWGTGANDNYPINTMTTFCPTQDTNGNCTGRTSFTRGYFEARMKWAGGGKGAWPSFWLTSERHADNPSWPSINPYCANNSLPAAECYASELDVMDNGGLVSDTYFDLHRNTSGDYGVANSHLTEGWFNYPAGTDLSAGWHTYAALWTSTQVKWYVDDVLVGSAPTYDSTNQPMFLLLQNWTHNDCWDCGATDGTDTDVQVDYVHVYQQ